MTILDTIVQMQAQGMSDEEIITNLKNQGINPKEINDSLNQAKIKNAVSDNPPAGENPAPKEGFEGMQQSIMQQDPNQTAQNPQMLDNSQILQQDPNQMQQDPNQMPQEPQQIDNQMMQEPLPEQTANDAQYYPDTPQAYSENAYYPQQGALDTDTITEIAEQVVAEKFSEFEKKTGDINSFKNSIEEKVKDLNERLKKIENTIDKLSLAIIQKIGEFGESTTAVHKDIENLHNTVSKLMNPLVDNYKELKKITGKK